MFLKTDRFESKHSRSSIEGRCLGSFVAISWDGDSTEERERKPARNDKQNLRTAIELYAQRQRLLKVNLSSTYAESLVE